jgi:hypothetical protein
VVNMHQLPGDAETMTQCHDCRDDLCGAHAPILDRSATAHRLVRCQTFLLRTMRTGWCRLWGPSTIQGAWFFGVLHRRVRVFLPTMRAPAFREVFGAYEPGARLPSRMASPTSRSIEGLGVEDRLELMRFVSWWFDQRPDEFMPLNAEIDLRPMGR